MTLEFHTLRQPASNGTSEISSHTSISDSATQLASDIANQDFKRAIALFQLAQAFDNLLSRVDVTAQIMGQICSFFQAQVAFVAEYFPEQKTFFITATHGFDMPVDASPPVELGQQIIDEVFKDGQLLFFSAVNQEPSLAHLPALPATQSKNFIAVPLSWRGVIVGVLGIYLENGWGSEGSLTENEREIIRAAANLTGQVLFNARLLKESEAARNDFTDMLVYGLKGPMASIMGALDLLYDSQGPDAHSAELLTIARRNGARMLTMIETLLDLNKLEHGDLHLEYEKVPLHQLIEVTWQSMEDQFLSKEIKGDIQLPQERVILQIDLSRVLKVMHHLVENALNFTEEGRIEFWAEVRQNESGRDEAVIAISDTGIGIKPDQLRELFDRFSRARQYRQLDLASGGGLGLNYAKLVVNAHGGQIWAESPGRLGKGTSFYLTLPIYHR